MRLLSALAVSVFPFLFACSAEGVEGSSCKDSSDCRGKLACVRGTCQVEAQLHQEMAAKSGIEIQTEQSVAQGGGLGAVRVRSATANEYAFAVCAGDERLISGWCDPLSIGSDNTKSVDQKILGHTEHDTIGARWACSFSDARVTANALCQKIDASD